MKRFVVERPPYSCRSLHSPVFVYILLIQDKICLAAYQPRQRYSEYSGKWYYDISQCAPSSVWLLRQSADNLKHTTLPINRSFSSLLTELPSFRPSPTGRGRKHHALVWRPDQQLQVSLLRTLPIFQPFDLFCMVPTIRHFCDTNAYIVVKNSQPHIIIS